MRFASHDQDGVSPVMATVLLSAIVIVLSASLFALVASYRDDIPTAAPVVAMTSRDTAMRLDSFDMRMISSSPAQPLENFLLILRTPHNGTLVTTPPRAVLSEASHHYFQLGPSAGDGVHHDNGTTVGDDGLGGFHIRIADMDGDGRFGGGDTIDVWFDGDGDQAHQAGRDDRLPSGTYTFELKHRPSESYVAFDTRTF